MLGAYKDLHCNHFSSQLLLSTNFHLIQSHFLPSLPNSSYLGNPHFMHFSLLPPAGAGHATMCKFRLHHNYARSETRCTKSFSYVTKCGTRDAKSFCLHMIKYYEVFVWQLQVDRVMMRPQELSLKPLL